MPDWFDEVKKYVRQITEPTPEVQIGELEGFTDSSSEAGLLAADEELERKMRSRPLATPEGWGKRGDNFTPNLQSPPSSDSFGGNPVGRPQEEEETSSDLELAPPPPPSSLEEPPPPPPPARAPRQLPAYTPEAQPEDRTRELEGLRGVANMGGLSKAVLGMDPDLHRFDTQLAQEKSKQDDWKKRTAEALRQRFETGQQNSRLDSQEGMRDLDRTSRETQAGLSRDAAAQNALAARTQAEDHFQRTNSRIVNNQSDLKDSRDADDSWKVSEKLPSPAAFDAGRRVKALLADGRTPAGFGKILNAIAKLNLPLGRLGENAGEIIRQAGLSPEESRQWNDAYALTMLTAFDLGGKALTEGEKEPIELMAGIRGGQGPEVLKHGLLRMINAQETKVKRGYSVLTPGGQARLRKMGFSPEMWGEPPADEDLTPDGGR